MIDSVEELYTCGAVRKVRVSRRAKGRNGMGILSETEQRAASVRRVLKYARGTSQPVIGLAPEGGDAPGGVLGPLPPGVGRFIHLLNQYCPQVLPVGVWTESGHINLKFGSPYHIEIPDGLSVHERDLLVGRAVMHQIALLLPDRLGGGYL